MGTIQAALSSTHPVLSTQGSTKRSDVLSPVVFPTRPVPSTQDGTKHSDVFGPVTPAQVPFDANKGTLSPTGVPGTQFFSLTLVLGQRLQITKPTFTSAPFWRRKDPLEGRSRTRAVFIVQVSGGDRVGTQDQRLCLFQMQLLQ